MANSTKVDQLKTAFPKLTEANQQYVLGLAEGLKHAQGGKVEEGEKEGEAESGERGEGETWIF